MTDYSIDTRQGLPTEMQALLRDYPREAWPDNPHFARSIQNWMSAHKMFRQLGEITRDDVEKLIEKMLNPTEFSRRFAYYGDLLVRNLHGHHAWEDRDYFPELSAADSRFDRGLEMLEADHYQLDVTLDKFTKVANRLLQLIELEEKQAREEAGELLESCQDIGQFLARHLQDEEDLVVAILLHHKMR